MTKRNGGEKKINLCSIVEFLQFKITISFYFTILFYLFCRAEFADSKSITNSYFRPNLKKLLNFPDYRYIDDANST